MGKRKYAEDRRRPVARNGQGQVTAEGRAAPRDGRDVERRHRIGSGSCDRVPWVPDGFSEPCRRDFPEPRRGDHRQAVRRSIDDHDHRRLNVELLSDHAEDFDARIETTRIGERSGAGSLDTFLFLTSLNSGRDRAKGGPRSSTTPSSLSDRPSGRGAAVLSRGRHPPTSIGPIVRLANGTRPAGPLQ